MKAGIVREFKLLWRFLGFFQRGALKGLHAVVAVLVIIQILDGYGTSISRTGEFSRDFWPLLASLWHIGAGSVLIVLCVAFTAVSLQARGARGLFPYLFNDFSQLRQDFSSILKGSVPPPRPRGLAACVQGLGLGAILLAVLSGAFWLWLWFNNVAWQADARWFHKKVVVLVELYAAGHGVMALLHYWMWRRKSLAG